jgi:hypothetical protein
VRNFMTRFQVSNRFDLFEGFGEIHGLPPFDNETTEYNNKAKHGA